MTDHTTEKAQKTQYDLYVERQSPERRQYARYARVEKAGKQTTLAEYIAAAEERGLDPSQVAAGSGGISWRSDETDEEVAARIQSARIGAEKHLAAIKRMYEDYAARGLYDQDIPPASTGGPYV
jgi:hypothetical protein